MLARVGDIVAVCARGRGYIAQVGLVRGRGDWDDHRALVQLSGEVTWVYPDHLLAPGTVYRGAVRLTHEEAALLRPQLDAMTFHPDMQAHLRLPATQRIDAQRRTYWIAPHARADAAAVRRTGAPDCTQPPIRPFGADSTEWTPELTRFLMDADVMRARRHRRAERLERERRLHPRAFAVYDARTRGVRLALIAEQLGLTPDQAKKASAHARRIVRALEVRERADRDARHRADTHAFEIRRGSLIPSTCANE